MRAAVYKGGGRLVVRDMPDPTPGPDEVLIVIKP
jgi:NADPH:quinone reductase-like Zn-dependent oxidoreductase